MNTELLYLTLNAILNGVMWIPYVIDRVMVSSLSESVGYPKDPKPQSPWAQRLMKAHANAVENLVIFAVLILVARTIDVTNATIANACIVYFWARVAHAVTYTFGIPWIRTLSFAVGYGSMAVIVWQLLSH